ncbi:MAG: hypothetical protein LJE70_17345 [Chromatiaceae bacterium]|jgi:hypothetical protein|nr:hypothetical protein [Chromatiaceae bacterium]
MIRIPFSRTSKDDDSDKPSVAFSEYCRDELERRRDTGVGFDEARFEAAVELAVGRLQAMEDKEGKA